MVKLVNPNKWIVPFGALISLKEVSKLLNSSKKDHFVSAVIVAAGSGTRMKIPQRKQLVEINDMPVIAHTLKAFENTDIIDEIVIVTDKGYGKRTNVDAFRVQVRGGKGVKALNITAKNGKMVSLSTVRGDEDLLVVTDKGMIIRTHLDQILTVGRDTQGVCIIKLNDGHSASTIAIVPRNEDEIIEDAEYKEEFQFDDEYTFLDEGNNE